MLSTYFALWAVTMIVVWQTNGYTTLRFDLVFRWLLLPLFLLAATITVSKNDYWGKGNWLCVLASAITFLTVPYTQYVEGLTADTVTFTFHFPNFIYMAVGIIISACGIRIGKLLARRSAALLDISRHPSSR